MNRIALKDLKNWVLRENRKPLVLRGARQVGKSTLVRHFAEMQGLELIEVNLEKHQLQSLKYDGIDLTGLLQEIEVLCGQRIKPGVLLFFDEIQEQPKLLSILRYFYEEQAWLPVISAGSLLEIALTNKEISIPVGRIENYFLGPMKFEEFLSALGDQVLLEYLTRSSDELSKVAHAQLVKRFREYLFVGGMPEAVKEFVRTKSPIEVRRAQRSILQTYQEDFIKYSKNSAVDRVRRVFNFVPGHLGQKIKYSEIDREEKSRDLKAALQLLIQARIIIPVFHTNASGIPLASTSDETVLKTYFLDVGLVNCLQDVDWDLLVIDQSKDLITKGAIAEQFVAQHLFYRKDGFENSELYYWLRDKKAQNAEVDFIIARKGEVLPIEVKSDVSGKLKSLLIFMAERKNLSRAIRINLSNLQSELVEKTGSSISEKAVFELLTIPLYMVDQIDEII